MPVPFPRTLRSLQADSQRRNTVRLVVLCVLMLGWLGWAVFGRVTLHELSSHARLECIVPVHRIEALATGRVVEKTDKFRIEQPVAKGDPLIRLDSTREELAVQRTRARICDLTARIESTALEIEAERRLAAADEVADRTAVEVARLHVEVGKAKVATCRRELDAKQKLQQQVMEAVSENDLDLARDLLRQAEANELALERTAKRLEQAVLARQAAHALQVRSLESERLRLQGQQQEERNHLLLCEADLKQRTISAPVDGVIGEVEDMQIGAVLQAGQVLGRIIPGGELRAVARFDVAVHGRIHEGQRALIRLEGFPWTRFGGVPATVARIAREPDNRRMLRVELSLQPDPHSEITPQHGLPGSVEVAVERISPLAVLLRAAGQLIEPKGEAEGSGPR